MNDETLRRQLLRIQGDEPSQEFLDGLRDRLDDGTQVEDGSLDDAGRVTVIDVEDRPQGGRRTRLLWPMVAAAVVIAGFLVALQVVIGEESDLETATSTVAHRVGDSWLQSIVEGDRATFRSLHADDVEVDDTLMGFSEDTGLLTAARIRELYYDGFDALQAAIAIDDDEIRVEGCIDIAENEVRCRFTATMIGTDDYHYSVEALLVVEDRSIISIDFSTTTNPSDFRSSIQNFLEEEATDEDRACLALGFNTTGCGEHESDFVTRYAAFYEAAQDPTGG
jgi:hypothetical protein